MGAPRRRRAASTALGLVAVEPRRAVGAVNGQRGENRQNELEHLTAIHSLLGRLYPLEAAVTESIWIQDRLATLREAQP